MSGTVGLALAGLVLGALALGADGMAVARWLDPPAVDRHAQVAQGVTVLRVLLGLDALLLLGLAAWRARGGAAAASERAALWQPPLQTAPDRRLHLALALALGLGALLLRAVGLDTDLWLDEVGTLVLFARVPLGELLTWFPNDNHHMAYSVLARLCVVAFGESEAAVRLPAVLFGLGSLAVLVRLGGLALSWRDGWFAAALLAFSYHHVWFSQNARAYTLLLFGTLLATDLFLRGLARPRAPVWIGYAATMALSAWGHMTMAFVGVAHGLLALWILVRERSAAGGRAWPLGGVLLSGWLTLHAYALVLPQILAFFSLPAAGSTAEPTEWTNPLWLVMETLRHLGVGVALGVVGALAVAAVGGLGLLRSVRRDPLFVVLMLLPAVVEGIVLVALGRSLWPRFFFHLLGFAALVAVSGALAVGDLAGAAAARFAPRARAAVAMLPAVFLVAVSAASLPRNYHLPKQDYTGARDWVKARLAPGDRVMGLHMAGWVYNWYYAPEWPWVESAEDFDANRATDGRTWVLYTLPGYFEGAYPELMQRIERDFEPAETFWGTLRDGQIV
ncbi:MAG: glycosyltransferase family 39 protein, partial [Myxococcota bacterium]